MGKLEKLGRSILKKLGTSRRSSSRRRREQETSTSSDEENNQGYVHKFQVVPPDDVTEIQEIQMTSEPRIPSPAASDEGSAGYATDDTALSSLGPLDIKRVSVDYSESQGYYSNAELSPIPRIEVTVPEDLEITVPAYQSISPRATSPGSTVRPAHHSPRSTVPQSPGSRTPVPRIPGVTVPEDQTVYQSHRDTVPAHQTTVPRIPGVTVPMEHPTIAVPKILGVTVPASPRITVDPPRTPLFTKKQLPSQEFPRVDVSRKMKKHDPIYKSSQFLPEETLKTPSAGIERSATLSNLTSSEDEDPIDRFMKSHIYKTKMITTIFEAKDRGFEEIHLDVCHEIDRWFEFKNMMAVACELHWSVPREKRSRQLECKLKEKLLHALRENNKRLLYLRGMGHGKTPVKLAESSTVENISRDRDTDSVRGIYQRSYTRLLPYLHKETPEWHSQYWTLHDLQKDSDDVTSTVTADPQKFLFESEPTDVLSKNSLISLNIIGLSILGNSRKSCGSLFLN